MGETKTEHALSEPRRHWHWLAAIVACVAVYVAMIASVGRPLGMDEVFFKAPGRNWARTGHLAAPELTGFLQQGREPVRPAVEEVWFVHPPLYPFLFGVWTRFVGFGPESCITFDAAIHGLLVLLTFALARRIGENLPDRVCFAIAIAILPIGIFCRPDELAMCFGLAALLPLLSKPRSLRNRVVSGVFLGLSAATSVGAAVLLGSVGFVLIGCSIRPTRRTASAITLWCVIAMATLMLAVAPVLLAHPTAIRQYLAHAAQHVHSGNVLRSLLTHWENEQFHRSVLLACLAVMAASFSTGTGQLPWSRWLRLWAGPFLALALLAIWLPDKIYYTWFFGPWMIIAAVVAWRTRVRFAHPLLQKSVLLIIVCFYAIALMPFCKNLAIMATLPRSQGLAENAARIRALIPPGSSVLTDDYWWVLADDHRVYDLYFAQVDPDCIDYIILTGNGSGDPNTVRRLPDYLADYVPPRFHPVSNTINTRPLSILGQEIPGTAFGFGALVLGRHFAANAEPR